MNWSLFCRRFSRVGVSHPRRSVGWVGPGTLFESRLDGLARDRRELDQLDAEWVFRVGEFDRSGEWQAQGFASAASAIASRCRMVPAVAAATVRLARRLQHLPQTAHAFEHGEISRHHVEMIAGPCTRDRREMLQGLEPELVAFARISDPAELRGAVQRATDAFDGDGGASGDADEYRKNRVNLSPSFGGRGVLNGSLDAESTEIAISALEAMTATLERAGDTREPPERRAEAFVEICRQSADRAAPSTRRERPHLSAMFDIRELEATRPDLVAQARIEAEHVGELSRATLERLLCDCELSRLHRNAPFCNQK